MDQCSYCGPPTNGTSPVLDCNDVCYGSVSSNDTSCYGCDGVPFSGLVYDACGVCNGTNGTSPALVSISPVADRNVADIVVTVYGAGFIAGATTATFGPQVLSVTVSSAGMGTVVLAAFANLGTYPVTLTISGHAPQTSNAVNYTALADMSVNPATYQAYIQETGITLDISGNNINYVAWSPVVCVFSDAGAPIATLAATSVSASQVVCPAPVSQVSVSYDIGVSINGGVDTVPVTGNGTLEIHYIAYTPVVASAAFSSSGATIIVTFNTTVDFFNDAPGTPVNCSALFTPATLALIVGATCVIDDGEQVTIILGNSCTTVPGNTIEFLDNVVLLPVCSLLRPVRSGSHCRGCACPAPSPCGCDHRPADCRQLQQL